MKSVKFISLTLIMTSLFFIISLLFLKEISVYSKQTEAINQFDCKYISIYEGEAKIETEYKLLNSFYSIYDGAKKVKVDILMQNKDEMILNEVILKTNEIAVSENFLEKGFKIGDTVFVTSPIIEDKIQFVIVDTISTCYGVSNEILDKNKCVVIFGYDENLLNYSLPNIAFINDEDISASNVKLQKFIQVNDMLEYNIEKTIPLIFIDILIKLSICILYILLFLMIFKYVIRRHIINGRSINSILLNTYIKYCSPLIIAIVLSIALTTLYSGCFLSYTPIYELLFALTIVIICVTLFLHLKIKMRRNLG